jgi:hypothetical protein
MTSPQYNDGMPSVLCTSSVDSQRANSGCSTCVRCSASRVDSSNAMRYIRSRSTTAEDSDSCRDETSPPGNDELEEDVEPRLGFTKKKVKKIDPRFSRIRKMTRFTCFTHFT